jgi:hypothetical protein
MAHNRITVLTTGEAWRDHARMLPEHLVPVGTLTRNGRTHAFGRDPAGDYWIFGDGRPEILPRIRVEKGLGALAMREAPKPDAVGD